MCVAIPMRIVELLPDRHGKVENDGVERKVNLRLLDDCSVNDYVLVHAGYAIEKISPEAAEENLRILDELKRRLQTLILRRHSGEGH